MQLTLICLRGSNNTSVYKVYVSLYFSYTYHHALKFIFIFISKSTFSGTGVELDNGSVIVDGKPNCTCKPKSNLQIKKIMKNIIKLEKRMKK